MARGNNTVKVKRSKVFYSKATKMPKEVTLTFTRPPVFANLDDKAASEQCRHAVAERETKERERIIKAGGRFMSPKAILRQRLTDTPKTSAKRFQLNPRIDAKNRWTRIEALCRLKDWYEAYRTAYEAWRDGDRDVEFPAGTYALRRFAGVNCAVPV